nr:MAG TPA: hypothetical protein [Bacteriophage sp.]
MGIFLCSFESVYHKDIRLSLPLDTHCSRCVYCSWRNGRRQPFLLFTQILVLKCQEQKVSELSRIIVNLSHGLH